MGWTMKVRGRGRGAARKVSRRSGVLAGIGVVATAATIGAMAVNPSLAHATPSNGAGCTQMMAYLVPGTTETSLTADPTQPKGMLASVAKKLEGKYGSNITVITVPYSASAFDKGLSYKQSAETGIKNLSTMMAKCPTSQVVVAGYSQGAEVAGDVLWHIGHENQPIAADRVRAAALLADPKRGNEKLVGNTVAGQGVEGGRPGGYGALEGRIKWVCDDKDMYCNTTSKNPFVGIIGKTITGNTDQGVPPLDGSGDDDKAMDSLTSNSDGLDLAGVSSKAEELKTRTASMQQAGSKPSKQDLDRVSSLATDLNKTYSSTKDISDFADKNGATAQLNSETDGTPGKQTAGVLSTLKGMDLSGMANDTASIANTATAMSNQDGQNGGGSGSNGAALSGALGSGGDALGSMATSAMNVAAGSGALNSTDSANLSTASSVLGQLKISTVVNTALSGATTVLSTDYMGIANTVQVMAGDIQRLDAKATHTDADKLMKMLQPWVDFADSANTDLMPMAATMLGMIPDPYGACAIASMVMKVMSQVDIKRLADNVEKAIDVSFSVLEGHPEAAVNLVPIGVDLGMVGLQAVSSGLLGIGGQAKTGQSAAQGIGGGQDLVSLSNQLTSSLGGTNWENVGQLATDGIDFGSFIASGAHTSSYTSKPMVAGLSGIDYIAQYFIVQLSGVAGGSSSSDNSSSDANANNSNSDSSDSDSSGSSDSNGSSDSSGNGSNGSSSDGSSDSGDQGSMSSGAPSSEVSPGDVDHGSVGPIN